MRVPLGAEPQVGSPEVRTCVFDGTVLRSPDHTCLYLSASRPEFAVVMEMLKTMFVCDQVDELI